MTINKSSIIVLTGYYGVPYDEQKEVVGVYHVSIDNFDIGFEFGIYQAKFYTNNDIPCKVNKEGELRFGFEKLHGIPKHKLSKRIDKRTYTECHKELKKFEMENSEKLSILYYIENVLKGVKLHFSECDITSL